METQSKLPEPDTIFEEREEDFILPPTRRKTHFIKPTAISSNGKVSELPKDHLSRKPCSYDHLEDMSEKVFLKGWKRPTQQWKTWVNNMHPKYQALWKQVGIYEAVMSSRYDIKQHKELVLCFAEKWYLETNTFVFPWGETTITLEDVMVCGGFSVLGVSVLSPLESKSLVEVEKRLIEGLREAARGSCVYATAKAWKDYFMGTEHELEHEAFLSLWLSKHVFMNSTTCWGVHQRVFPIAIHLARGNRVALAPAVLSTIYRDLSLLKNRFFGSVVVQSNDLVNLYAPFQLLQVWVWERFPGFRPRPNSISQGEPRIARWHRLKVNVTDMKLAMDSAGNSFLWRPYGIAVSGLSLPKFYGDKEQLISIDSNTYLNEEIHSFAICLRVSELVGLDSIEQYLPHRVSMQFGIDQDLPGCFARCNVNPYIAWRNYSRPIRDAVLYIPPRLFESDVTAMYSDWWKLSVLDYCDPMKSFLKRPRSSKNLHVSLRKKVCNGNSSKRNEEKGMEARNLAQEEDMEDQLTIKELLICAKHNSVNSVTGSESERESKSPRGAQSQSCSTKETEVLAKMEANMKLCVVNIESSDDEDKKYETLKNISETLSVGECQNVQELIAVADKDVKKSKFEAKQDAKVIKNGNPIGESKGWVTGDVKANPCLKDGGEGSNTNDRNVPSLIAVADNEDVKKSKFEAKQDAVVIKNGNSIGESKGWVTDDVKSNPGLKDGGEGNNTNDRITPGLDLETRICRLEKLLAKLKK